MIKAVPVLLFAALAVAQEPIPAKSFVLDDYHNVVSVDLAKLRAKDIWGDLEASVLKPVLTELEREFGGPLDSLDRMLLVAEFGDPAEDARLIREVRVFEGNTGLPVPTSLQAKTWEKRDLGGREVWCRSGFREERMYQPSANVQVWGTGLALDPVFEGEKRHGMPCADVMSLLSGKEESLAYIVLDVTRGPLRNQLLRGLFKDVDWPQGQEPSFLALRLLVTGDPDDPHLTVEAVLRHAADGEGVAVSDKAIDAFLERARTAPEFRAMRPVLREFHKKRDRADLLLVADLGRSRQAVGNVAGIVIALLGPQGRAATVEAEVAVPPPPPPPPVEPPKKKD
ncbi:MAG: hypothetical protein H6838_04600 [Planctomycetes bacterium]|nr:hypothetical protein [Planctomycetota bacterium]